MASWIAGGARADDIGIPARAALSRWLLCLWLALAPWAPAAANVLILYSNGRLLPANVEVDRGLNESSDAKDGSVRLFAEFLGTPEFDGDAYRSETAAYLKVKYAARLPQVLVAGGPQALDFFLRYRDEMFPRVPVVHVGADESYVRTHRLPPDVIGIPTKYDVQGTLELALQLHPSARRLIVVTGSSRWGLEREVEVRDALAALRPSLPVEHLKGLPSAEVLARLAAAGSNAVVFTPGYFRDGAGRAFTPKASVEMMAAASTAPVYALYASQIGTGAVGGRMTSYVEMGRATRAIIDRLLDGVPPSEVPVPASLPAPAQVDWRQIRRWHIATDLLPADTIIHYREPTLWEAYRTQTIVALAVVLVQAGLIAALLIERRLRRRTAAALAESQEHVHLAAQAARLSTFVWDVARAGVSSYNRAWKQEAVVRQSPTSFQQVLQTVHPADRERFELAVRGAAANHTELDIEYRELQPNGAERWLAARGHAPAGESQRLTGVSMDITVRKTAELQADADRDALRHMSRVSTMGQLSAAIAHQLNQPLAAILGNAETARKMLGRENASLDEVREILDDIVTDDHRAAEIIRRLGALYKRGEIELAPLDLNDLVRETLELLRSELVTRHVAPVIELDASRPMVLGSRIQLQQVVLNLVLNAADAMQHVDASRRVVTVRTTCAGPDAELRVIDRGTGLPEADIKRVFEPFWTTKETGLGVGLAICSAIISAHRGSLAATNNPDAGATFCARLPLVAPVPTRGVR